MAITGVSHIGLCVSDLDAVLHFYCDLLGFRLLQRITDVGSAEVARLLELDDLELDSTFIERDGVRIELISIAHPRPTGGREQPFDRLGCTHLSVTVSDFDAERERLRRAKVTILEGSSTRRAPGRGSS